MAASCISPSSPPSRSMAAYPCAATTITATSSRPRPSSQSVSLSADKFYCSIPFLNNHSNISSSSRLIAASPSAVTATSNLSSSSSFKEVFKNLLFFPQFPQIETETETEVDIVVKLVDRDSDQQGWPLGARGGVVPGSAAERGQRGVNQRLPRPLESKGRNLWGGT